MCNNLSAKGRTNSFYEEDDRVPKASVIIEVETSKLRRSSASGCRYCALLSQSLDFFWEEWTKTHTHVTITLKDDAPVKLSFVGGSLNRDCLELYTVPGEWECPLVDFLESMQLACNLRLSLLGVRLHRTSLGSAHSLSNHLSSEESMEFVKKCIEHCIKSTAHGRCIQPASHKPPNRLLNIGESESKIKLCSTKSKALRYAALSHCWGDGPLLTTTLQTLEDRMKGIEIDDLPELFQDAVKIARNLSIQHLWIDALCIVQDDRADWDVEAALMGNIYENAFITIAAVGADNSGQSCLRRRPKPTRVMYTDTKGKATPIKVRKVVDHHSSLDETKPMTLLGPLTKRAWALQEHVLCTRVAHFTPSEIIFECRTSLRCECRTMAKKGATIPGIIPKLLSSSNEAKIFAGWHDIVEQYSKRKLTFPHDKLPAIAGIASKFLAASGSEYVAGIWKKNFARDILWTAGRCDGSPPWHIPVPAEYRAPTFSWASVDGTIEYNDTHSGGDDDDDDNGPLLKPALSLLGLNVQTTTGNQLGQVVECAATVRCKLIEATLVFSARSGTAAGIGLSSPYSIRIGPLPAIEVSPDTVLLLDSDGGGPRRGSEPLPRQSQPQLLAGDTSSLACPNPSELDCFPQSSAAVLCLKVAIVGHEYVEGLVLAPSKRVTGAYERLGRFACAHECFAEGEKKAKIKLV